MPSTADKLYALACAGFTVGQRDPRLNTDYPGSLMVVEGYELVQLPTRDGSDGPWCVVGDNLDALIDQGFDFLVSTVDPS